MSNPSSKLQAFKAYVKEREELNSAVALLRWDQRTQIPPKGHDGRAEVIGKLSKLSFEMLVSPRMAEFLDKLDRPEVLEGLDEQDRAMVRVIAKDHRRQAAIPPDLYERFVVACSKAETVWERARAESDFERFRPHLEEIVDFVRQFAELYGYEENPYDALLEGFEPGLTTADLSRIIEALREELVPFVRRLLEEGTPPATDFLRGTYPLDRQRELCLRALKALGYDLEAGRLDTTAHPFSIAIGPGDVRVTTRFLEGDLLSALFSTMHECGHALYSQGMDPNLFWTGLDEGASYGIHESQSRLMENFVGRSLPFWRSFYPELVEVFPAFRQIPVEDFYRAANRVERSTIRVEADEVTYNLHVMLRFELEEALLNRRVEVRELPELWREAMERYLDVTPPDDAQGVLQDVHWSNGYFGYFPSYMLGNLYAAQIFQAARKEIPDLEGRIERGEIATLRAWLRERVHRFGRMYEPKELLQRVTGEGPNPRYFLDYLTTKYGEVYRI